MTEQELAAMEEHNTPYGFWFVSLQGEVTEAVGTPTGDGGFLIQGKALADSIGEAIRLGLGGDPHP